MPRPAWIIGSTDRCRTSPASRRSGSCGHQHQHDVHVPLAGVRWIRSASLSRRDDRAPHAEPWLGVIVSPTATSSPTITSSRRADRGRRSPSSWPTSASSSPPCGHRRTDGPRHPKIDATNLRPWRGVTPRRWRSPRWSWRSAIRSRRLSQTVTLGSSRHSRNVEGLGTYEDCHPDRAAITAATPAAPHQLGAGELVGINSAIYSETGGYQVIGLAVPSNLSASDGRVDQERRRPPRERCCGSSCRRLTSIARQSARRTRGVRSCHGSIRNHSRLRRGLRPGDVSSR